MVGGRTSPVLSTCSTQSSPALHDFLRDIDMLKYHGKLKNDLKLRHAGDLVFCEEKDLSAIGMSRPEQKRLRHEFSVRFPNAPSSSSSLVLKLKKIFTGPSKDPLNIGTSADSAEATEEARLANNIEQQLVIPAENINLCKELGKGEFGCVYHAAWHIHPNGSTNQVLQVAVKRVLPEKLTLNTSNFLQEAAIMTKMRHPNVIRLYGVVLDTKAVMLVSELAPCGSLLECLQCPALREPFPITILCDFALQIARGMSYLASQRLIHRDLAARNVLVSSPTEVKISDFGLSRSLGVDEDYYRSEFSPSMRLPIAWCAPECVKYLRFTSASDVWSYGVTLWEIFSNGQIPWANMTGAQILTAIDSERRVLDIPNSCPTDFYLLMCQCWRYEASSRPTFDEICERLPNIMPQLLVATVDSDNHQNLDFLQYRKADIIILLNKRPHLLGKFRTTLKGTENLWYGAQRRSGSIPGLFHPDNTVAHLDAEYPSTSLTGYRTLSQSITPQIDSSSILSNNSKNKDEKKRKAKAVLAEADSERRKLLISQPQGTLRHTGHLGVDGKAFGVMFDPKCSPTPATFAETDGGGMQSASPTLMSASFSEGCSGVGIGAAAPPSLEPFLLNIRKEAHEFPTSVQSKSNKENQEIILKEDEDELYAKAPPRPNVPPPSFLLRSQEFNHNYFNNNGASEPNEAENTEVRIKSPNVGEQTHLVVRNPLADTEESDRFVRPISLLCDNNMAVENNAMCCSANIKNIGNLSPISSTEMKRLSLVDRDATKRESCGDKAVVEYSVIQRTKSATPLKDQKELDEVLSELQKDITNFSLSTVGDFSDTRPLLDGDRRRNEGRMSSKVEQNGSCKDSAEFSSVISSMTDDELAKWRSREAEEHQKAERCLQRQREQDARLLRDKVNKKLCQRSKEDLSNGVENATTGTSSGGNAESSTKNSKTHKTFRSQILESASKNVLEASWSDEAQAAYKLLVEFGNGLKAIGNHELTENSACKSDTFPKRTVVGAACSSEKLSYISKSTSPPVARPSVKEDYTNSVTFSRDYLNSNRNPSSQSNNICNNNRNINLLNGSDDALMTKSSTSPVPMTRQIGKIKDGVHFTSPPLLSKSSDSTTTLPRRDVTITLQPSFVRQNGNDSNCRLKAALPPPPPSEQSLAVPESNNKMDGTRRNTKPPPVPPKPAKRVQKLATSVSEQ